MLDNLKAVIAISSSCPTGMSCIALARAPGFATQFDFSWAIALQSPRTAHVA
jgi:hypothetical protein